MVTYSCACHGWDAGPACHTEAAFRHQQMALDRQSSPVQAYGRLDVIESRRSAESNAMFAAKRSECVKKVPQPFQIGRSALLRCHNEAGVILLFDTNAGTFRTAVLLSVVLADRHEERELLAAFPADVIITRHRQSLDGSGHRCMGQLSFTESRAAFQGPCRRLRSCSKTKC
jgi:hypothetical protein